MGRTDAVAFTLECVREWRRLGATVTFQDGFDRRGNGTSADYEGGTLHHTASSSSSVRPFPTRSLLINGRPDLSGPLCNVAGPWCPLESPLLHVIAAHPANHAGASGGRSMGPLPLTRLFNKRVFGLEIDYAGSAPMSAGQYRAALIFTAGVSRVLGRASAEWVRGHAETSITGKWDPGFAPNKTIDLAVARRDAWTMLASTPTTGGSIVSTRDEVWQAPVPDLFTASPSDSLPAFAALGWANAHAAFARQAAEAAAASCARIEQKLDQLLARPAGSAAVLDPAAVTAGVRAALGGGLDITGTATPKQ